jgi:hypothetical protein
MHITTASAARQGVVFLMEEGEGVLGNGTRNVINFSFYFHSIFSSVHMVFDCFKYILSIWSHGINTLHVHLTYCDQTLPKSAGQTLTDVFWHLTHVGIVVHTCIHMLYYINMYMPVCACPHK